MDGRGVPLSLVVTGANRHDVTQLKLVLDEIVIDAPTRKRSRSISALIQDIQEKRRDWPWRHGATILMSNSGAKRFRKRRTIQDVAPDDGSPRRVMHFNRFRKLLVRYEKPADSYLALLLLAAAIIAFRKIRAIYG